jgi:hypothetical protein
MPEKSKWPKGLYERLLAERESTQVDRGEPLDSDAPREPEQEATADQPEPLSDLRLLRDLMRAGGPGNCASSLWFSSLKDRYPSEYETLKAEHLATGNSLHEGFPHTRGFVREELQHLGVNENLVFCVDQQGSEEYGFFMHEADVLLWALGGAVERGELTLDQLREYWQPYRRLWPTLYEANLKEWNEHLWPRLEGGDYDTPVTTNFFMRKARGVGMPDVGYLGGYSMSTGDIFEVSGADALKRLRDALAGSYRIALMEDLSDYTSIGPEEAMRLFESTLTGEDTNT